MKFLEQKQSCLKWEKICEDSYGWIPFIGIGLFCNECGNKLETLLDIARKNVLKNFIQPERSKREDKCDLDIRHNCPWHSVCRDENHSCNEVHLMRCSEHCGNTVRDK